MSETLDAINAAAGYKYTLEVGRVLGRCIKCGEEFSNENTITHVGFHSMTCNCMCELCWRHLFKDSDGSS